MTRPRPRDTIARWWYVTLVMVLAGAAATRGVVIHAAPKVAELPAPSGVHNPDPGRLDALVRDPFMTGTEWRAKLRERTDVPTPMASSAGVAPVAPPPPPAPGTELGFAGTMRSGNTIYAVLASGMVRTGAQVGRYVIEDIADDRIVIAFDGQRATLKMASGGVISTVATPTTTGGR